MVGAYAVGRRGGYADRMAAGAMGRRPAVRARRVYRQRYAGGCPCAALGLIAIAVLFWCSGPGAVAGQPEPLRNHGRDRRGQLRDQGDSELCAGARDGHGRHYAGDQRHVCAVVHMLCDCGITFTGVRSWRALRSEEHTSELQSLMRISYAVFCLKKKNRLKIKKYMYIEHRL